MPQNVLKLYIAGRTAKSERAISNLRVLCEGMLDGQFVVDIIDVLEHPEHAGSAGILVTPTLVKESPPPYRRVIGDLSDVDRVIFELDLRPDRQALALQPEGPALSLSIGTKGQAAKGQARSSGDHGE